MHDFIFSHQAGTAVVALAIGGIVMVVLALDLCFRIADALREARKERARRVAWLAAAARAERQHAEFVAARLGTGVVVAEGTRRTAAPRLIHWEDVIQREGDDEVVSETV